MKRMFLLMRNSRSLTTVFTACAKEPQISTKRTMHSWNRTRVILTFEEILTYLYEKTGAVHASFSSKLLATVNPNMPIWDKFVLQNLGLRTPYTYQKDRLQKTVQLYQQICDWYGSEQAKEKLREFNELFPNVDISDVKKIDFILWATR